MAALALGAFASVPAAAAGERTLYERVEQALAARDDLADLGKPAPELRQVHWMLGSWTVEARVFATDDAPERVDRGRAEISLANGGTWLQTADTYPEGTQDLGFLTYNIVSKRWVSVGLDSVGNSVISTGVAWDGNALVLQAENIRILGVPVTLRQTVRKIDDDRFTLLNEERLPSGTWVRLDEYTYRRTGS